MVELFKGIKVDWLGKRKLFFIISIALLLIGMVSLVTRGFRYGLDFKGGTVVTVKFNEAVDIGSDSKFVATGEHSNDPVARRWKPVPDRTGKGRGNRGCQHWTGKP